MKLEDIFAEWDKDSQFDRTKLDIVALGLPQMHAKYLRILAHERLVLRKYEADYKELKLQKQVFYVDGPDEEQVAKGWQLPPKGRIVKSDVGPWLEADKDIIALSLRIGMQQEKVEVLKGILDSVKSTGWNVKSAIDWAKFQSGQ
jgi:hypothetical protein